MIVDRRAPIYPIRTVAHLTGVNPRRIRAWEDQYNLLSPARTAGGHRLYSEEDVERIRWVKAMVDRGLSLKGIQRLVEQQQAAPPAPTGAARAPASAHRGEEAPRQPVRASREDRGTSR
jgi:DNA-binding transcriptional MerR regulator